MQFILASKNNKQLSLKKINHSNKKIIGEKHNNNNDESKLETIAKLSNKKNHVFI